MADAGQKSHSGGGWGSIEGYRVRILLLGAPDRLDEVNATARAVGVKHDVQIFAPQKAGLGTGLAAARAATEIAPHIVHSIGHRGAAKAAGKVAAGIGVPVVVSLRGTDLEGRDARSAASLAKRAGAVVVQEEVDADQLRAQGIKRDIYVTSTPDAEPGDGDRFYLGAIEIVYGRLIDAAGVSLEGAETSPRDKDGSPLVTIGAKGLSGRGDGA